MERERESAEGGLLASGSGMEIAPLSDWITSDGREGCSCQSGCEMWAMLGFDDAQPSLENPYKVLSSNTVRFTMFLFPSKRGQYEEVILHSERAPPLN